MALQFYPLRVTGIETETPEAYTLSFENLDPDRFHFLAGQYLTLKVPVAGEVLRRAFSISSAPGEDTLSVTIKQQPGGRVSRHLRESLEIGDRVEVLPPMGNFTVAPDPARARHFVLIGSGSGITPLMSMAKTLLRDEPRSRVTLLYGNRTEESIIFRQQLSDLQLLYPQQFAVVHVLSQPQTDRFRKGRLEGALLESLISEAVDSTNLPTGYYLCGPEGMMLSAKAILAVRGVLPSQIHTEYYSAPIAADGDSEDDSETEYEIVTQQVEVVLDGTQYRITVTPDTTILHAVLAAGLDAPYACEEGVCCTCRARLHSGMVSMDEREGLSDEELEAGYILTCQSHPLTADVSVEYG